MITEISPAELKARRQLNIENLTPQDEDYDQWRPHPEQPQNVWDKVWNLGQEAKEERQFA